MDIKTLITEAQFKALFPGSNSYEGFLKTAEKYNINTLQRIAHFLAQSGHESGGLTVYTENLNYSKDALLRVFGKYFNNTTAGTYARDQIKIANVVYRNRLGNGDERSGDGWKYRGRGAFQVTGKDNYLALSKDTGIDFVSNPDLLAQPEYALLSAGWYWDKNGLNAKADQTGKPGYDALFQISKAVNNPSAKTESAVNGYADRKAKYLKIVKTLG